MFPLHKQRACPLFERKMPQHGTAATEPSARDDCADCGNTAVSRNAERDDFIPSEEDEGLISGRTV